MPPKPILTVDELAAKLRVNPITIYRAIKRGEIPAIRVGRQYRIRVEDLERAFLVKP